MNIIQKIIFGALAVVTLGVAGYFLKDTLISPEQKNLDTPEKITTDYKNLLAKTEQLQTSAGSNCENKNDINKKIEEIEKELTDLTNRKKDWLDNVPKLPDVEPEVLNSENPLGNPGSEVPDLGSDIPELPDIYPENTGAPGSQVPELTPDLPQLPEININGEYIPDMPEINTGNPGSEVPDLGSDIPELPEIDVINPDEYISQIDQSEQKIKNILQVLKNLCQQDQAPKIISDKCSDACQKHKDCAAYTEDVTPADLTDAYNTCMEECPTWPKETVKCINAVDIKTPNDCVSFVQCQLPQFYEEKYLPTDN